MSEQQLTIEDFIKSKRPKLSTRKEILHWMLQHKQFKTPYDISDHLKIVGYTDGLSDSSITRRLRELRDLGYKVEPRFVRKGSRLCEYRVSEAKNGN